MALALIAAQSSPSVPSQQESSGSSIIVPDASKDAAPVFSGIGSFFDLSGTSVTVSFLVSDYFRKMRNDDILPFSLPARATPASRRDQLTIVVDILTFTQKPARRKRILRYLNLSQYQLKKYLGLLIAKGFLAEEVGESRTYKITEKGIELVRLLEGEPIRSVSGG